MNKTSNVFQNSKKFASKHKFLSFCAIIIVIILGYYGFKTFFGSNSPTTYFVDTVKKGTIISSVSGSGQLSATTQIDIKAKVSGEVVYVGVNAGDPVYVGQTIMKLDDTDAQAAATAAEQSLEASKLQYKKDSAQAPIDYQKLQDSLDNANTDLQTAYNDAFNSLSNTYLDIPAAITGVQNALFGYDLSSSNSQWNVDVLSNIPYGNDTEKTKMSLVAKSAKDDYAIARTKYDASIIDYKKISRGSAQGDIDSILTESIDTATAIAQALQSELNLFSTATDIATTYNRKLGSPVNTMQTSARSYLSTTNSDLSALLSQKKNIDADKATIKSDEQNITLMQVGNTDGANPISLQISKNNLDKSTESLRQQKTALLDYTITAPFSGIISAVNFKKNEIASGAVANIITNQQVAKLSLNEVDTAKIKIGDKVILTFDAIDGLSLTGSVTDIDTVGTVSQGVVSYTVTIGLDSQDKRAKPGMTANASIQTEVHQDVLIVPSSAVKTKSGQSYVQVFDPPLSSTVANQGITSDIAPIQIPVTIGISDDTNVEILSGLTEGEQIVTKTSTGAAAAAARTTTTSLFGGGGARAGGAVGGVRIP
ncbi:MAG: HlyD family efflux transporter periplasmic adaptor subunit [Candidatus Paceibacterota bacterium]